MTDLFDEKLKVGTIKISTKGVEEGEKEKKKRGRKKKEVFEGEEKVKKVKEPKLKLLFKIEKVPENRLNNPNVCA